MMSDATTRDFDGYCEQVRGEIDAALAAYTHWDGDCPTPLGEAIRHSLLAPGKRLRPLLVLMATECCGQPRQGAMPAACAVEMVHTYSLIHDDLPAMDDDDFRRGRPSCHAKYGEAVAILAGDALLALAFEVLAEGVRPPEVAARCCTVLARAAGPTALVGGQVADLQAGDREGTIELLRGIHSRKTGALFRACLQLGGLVAGAEQTQLQSLDVYGSCLGLAFQIVDDLLDRTGSKLSLGKSPGKDSEQNKLTFPALLGVEASRQEAERLICEAREALTVFGPSASRLDGLARFVVERKR